MFSAKIAEASSRVVAMSNKTIECQRCETRIHEDGASRNGWCPRCIDEIKAESWKAEKEMWEQEHGHQKQCEESHRERRDRERNYERMVL